MDALTLDMGETSRDSTRMRGLYTFCLAKPGSITYTMPSMVSDVSAMLVDTMILRPFGPPVERGGGACMATASLRTKALIWRMNSAEQHVHRCGQHGMQVACQYRATEALLLLLMPVRPAELCWAMCRVDVM